MTDSDIFQLFLSKVLRNFKSILNLTPDGKILSKELRKYPSIISCSTLIWMDDWPEEGYRDIAILNLDLPDL